MQAKQRLNKHRQKLSNIRSSLCKMPIFNHTTLQLKKLEHQENLSSTNTKIIQTESHQNQMDSPQISASLFFEKYNLGEKIGQGAHGVVKKCYLKQTNKLYAVKSIRLDPEHILFLKRNFTDIKHLRHKNIIQYKALFLEMDKEQCHLVMDYSPYPDLLHINIHSQQQLKEIFYQISQTLAYLHSHQICHRDIKPENILYDEVDKNIKIIDFGISKKLMNRGQKTDMLTITGTMFYRAPQMFQGGGYDQRVDLWALGVTLFKLMAGYTPFESIYHTQTIDNILKGQFIFPSQVEAKYSKAARNLVSRLLKPRNERLTAKEALLDIWLIDLYQGADEITRSLALNCKLLRMFGHSTKIVPQNFQRSTTLQQTNKNNPHIEINKTKMRQILIEQQQSQIFCSEEQSGHAFA